MFSNIKRRIQNRQKYIDLLWILVKTNFKMRYQNSVLGILWVMIKPLATYIVLYNIWSNFGTGNTIQHFPIYLLTGIIFYTYFQELIVYGQMALLEKAHIILKVSFPRQIAIVSSLFSALINLLINFLIALFIILISGFNINFLGFLYFVFLVVCLFILSTGIAFFTSIITIRFRDLKNIFDLGLFLLFWASPVFYVRDNSLVNSSSLVSSIIELNPLTPLLNQVRAAFGIIYDIDFNFAVFFLLISLVVLLFGWKFFSVAVRKIAEYF